MRGQLNYKEFKLLTTLDETRGLSVTQRELSAMSGLSVGTVNKVVADLTGADLMTEGSVTQAGFEALEPYRVQRAVLIAAGFGTRLVPITLNTPKPLIRVRGDRIIDSLLEALSAAGIEEVYIVRGYLSEQFDQLRYRYPNIEFIENPFYNEANNISSALAAKDLLENAYVMESDLLLYNRSLITRYQYDSNYLGVPVEVTDDWCFESKRGVITKLTVGGTNCHHMFGISYWTSEDGKKLSSDIEATFTMPGGKERYWDEVPLNYFAKNYTVRIRECGFEDVVEIDTFRELQEIDPAYSV
ncbi:sugar phosphate nucleotidyltransferase [Raoultibacter phocaeensis]|uniref:sugar phosphate nucleotidyltransferase n=1 Tax=Raoultibacter phocaeensis TaxID=2479841 RepID=UPI001119C815|nr:sugar phosphate nucleotidyltransferase [Raoultibacter phocaeensis]